MSDEQREPAKGDQPTGPEGKDQQTQESPALSFSSPAGGPGAAPSEPAAPPVTPFSPPPGGPGAPSEPAPPPATPPELWSSPASQSASAVGAFPVPELDKAPRVETVPAPEGSPSGGGFDANRVISVARTLAEEKPEVLVGAAFGGGLLLAIIIRRLGS